MKNDPLVVKLYNKMQREQNEYRAWLLAQPPEEMLHHAYEYSVREDIILATEEMNLTLAQRFDGMRLGAGAVEQVVAEYGLERTKYVLAAAIQTRDGDGRISRTNRKWADSIRTIKDMDRRGFDRSCYYADLQAHTCLLDGFVNQVRKFERAKAQPAQDTPER